METTMDIIPEPNKPTILPTMKREAVNIFDEAKKFDVDIGDNPKFLNEHIAHEVFVGENEGSWGWYLFEDGEFYGGCEFFPSLEEAKRDAIHAMLGGASSWKWVTE